jgi:hypothetical protein
MLLAATRCAGAQTAPVASTPVTAAHRFLSALASGDGARAGALLTPEMRERFTDYMAQAARSSGVQAPSRARALSLVKPQAPASQLQQAVHARLITVSK